MKNKFTGKLIFVSGGVISGLGKGNCAASIGVLLQNAGYKIGSLKCENYLNIDSGMINPIEHGDSFLCEDGLEADMDLGTYERFLNVEMCQNNYTTMGQIYQEVIHKERNMYYKGEDVEAVPHVVNEINERIIRSTEGNDITIIELGGTVGEYQNALYYEACRTLKLINPQKVLNIHLSYVLIPPHLGEPKTKPTQMSIQALMSTGVYPDFLILRAPCEMDKRRMYVLGMKTNIDPKRVFMAPDTDNIYAMPLIFKKQKVGEAILKSFGLKRKDQSSKIITKWNLLNEHINKSKDGKKVTIGIVGKYMSKNKGDHEVEDVYHSLIQSIKHASWYNQQNVKIKFFSAEELEDPIKGAYNELKLKKMDGVIVPIGWGTRGVEGKIKAIQIARENKIPYLGLCYGMQLACVEFARNVLNMKSANSVEIDPQTKYPIIHDIPFNDKYQSIKGKGVSMRLGGFDCLLQKESRVYSIYKKHQAFKDKSAGIISERHRHRFEFNNVFRKQLSEGGLVFSGTSPDNFFVEMVELPVEMHPFFIATQAHPEYKSTPLKPHPLFIEFLVTAGNLKGTFKH